MAYAQEKSNLFRSMDVGVSAGTAGIGLDVSMPFASWGKVRLGGSFMPKVNVPMTFGVSSYIDGQGVAPVTNMGKFEELMSSLIGLKIDDRIDMNAKANMADFKLLVDFYPIKNKQWYLTAGFYWGASKIGMIENNIHEMPSLMGMVVYNNMYEYFVNERYIDEPIYNDIYIDPDMGDVMKDKFLRHGRLGAHVGDFKDNGEPYMMVPGEDGVLEAKMYVNSFKPYLGTGYACSLTKDNRLKFNVDLGALFWGGSPDILTHNNLNLDDQRQVNLVKDVDNIHGKVGRYVRFASKLKVFPVLNLRISYTIF